MIVLRQKKYSEEGSKKDFGQSILLGSGAGVSLGYGLANLRSGKKLKDQLRNSAAKNIDKTMDGEWTERIKFIKDLKKGDRKIVLSELKKGKLKSAIEMAKRFKKDHEAIEAPIKKVEKELRRIPEIKKAKLKGALGVATGLALLGGTIHKITKSEKKK